MPILDSEALMQVEYQANTRTLFVLFAGGDWYAYLNVARSDYGRLLAAESKGRFFQHAIRDRYAYRRLGPLRPLEP